MKNPTAFSHKAFLFANKEFIFLLFFNLLFFVKISGAQRLDLFTAKTGTMNRNGTIIFTPYSNLISYFGFFDPDTTIAVNGRKKASITLYMDLREDINEIGIRVISPVPSYVFPDKGDLVSESYTLREKEKPDYFDPDIKLFLFDSTKSSDIAWRLTAENDNDSELLQQPSGKKNNAQIRIFDPHHQTSRTNIKGIYKIEISCADSIPKPGSFLLQAGSTAYPHMLRISENPDHF